MIVHALVSKNGDVTGWARTQEFAERVQAVGEEIKPMTEMDALLFFGESGK